MQRRHAMAMMAAGLSQPVLAQSADHAIRDLHPRTFDARIIPNFSLELIEMSAGTGLALAALDTQTGAALRWNDSAGVPLDGSIALLLAGAVLRRIDRGQDDPARPVAVRQQATGAGAGPTVTLDALCAGVLTRGDRTATRLLFDAVGGTDGLTRFLHDIADRETEVIGLAAQGEGNLQGTTTARQMIRNLNRLLLQGDLTTDSTARLLDWMSTGTTGAARLRAGVPDGWGVADLAADGRDGESMALGAIYPPGRRPLLMATCFGPSPRPPAAQDRLHAELARIATGNLLLAMAGGEP